MKRGFLFLCVAGILAILINIIIVNWNSPGGPLDKMQYRSLDLVSVDDEHDAAEIARQKDRINTPYQIGLRFAGYPNIDDVLPDKVTIFYVSRERQIIVVQHTGLHDDSVFAREIRVDMVLEGDSWKIEWAGGRWRCQSGRGSSTWTTSLCS